MSWVHWKAFYLLGSPKLALIDLAPFSHRLVMCGVFDSVTARKTEEHTRER